MTGSGSNPDITKNIMSGDAVTGVPRPESARMHSLSHFFFLGVAPCRRMTAMLIMESTKMSRVDGNGRHTKEEDGNHSQYIPVLGV